MIRMSQWVGSPARKSVGLEKRKALWLKGFKQSLWHWCLPGESIRQKASVIFFGCNGET